MAQQIIIARPPIYDQIVEVFPFVKTVTGAYFSWGSRIYNPDGVDISKHVLAHEAIHGQRQLDTKPQSYKGLNFGQDFDDLCIRAWWDKYLVDPQYRYKEELVAHRAEYGAFRGSHKDPKLREWVLRQCAERLSSAFYGNIVTYLEARKAIRG